MASNTPSTAHLTSYDDFSGISTASFSNPYDALIAASDNDAKQLQDRYQTHRTSRNAQQKAKLLGPDFAGVSVDPILQRLEDPSIEPGFVDPRHCLVFWARPPQQIKDLVAEVQRRLQEAVPNLWLMPQTSLHMTALEVTHSQTPETIHALVDQLRPSIPSIVNHTLAHRARLIKPLLGYDASAIALSFVPAAGEGLTASAGASGKSSDPSRTPEDDAYTYHHLRRDLYAKATAAGVKIESRYVVPSAHLTIARFIRAEDFHLPASSSSSSSAAVSAGSTESAEKTATPAIDAAKVAQLVRKIEEVNAWLEGEYWPRAGASEREDGVGEGEGINSGGEWVVGEGKGLDCRMGALWYGAGGETVMLGEGF